MPLSWNEIKSRALAFSKEWADAANEDSEAKPFLLAFFEVFGLTNKRIATFEHAVTKYGGKQGYVDLFWPGILLVEMKSRGKNLDRAFDQAMDYFSGIKESDLPRYILVCDFDRFSLTDLESTTTVSFAIKVLHKNVRLFGFIAGYQTQVIPPQHPINIKAAERMGRLHDQLKAIGYEGRPLEIYLVRLLFCLFAEDTGIFERRQFQDYLEAHTKADGSDLGPQIGALFHNLNTPAPKRLTNLEEDLAAFPYINGKLFAEPLPPASFDTPMREALLDLCALDWSQISPAIFGSLFQSIMDKTARRNLGAHYTSEENILKLIKPLFLDALWAEFEKIKKSKPKLFEFQQKLRRLTFLDPACGCGNFLVIAYRELRLLELEILRALYNSGQQSLDITAMVHVDVDQFYGIEIEEFPAQIAQVALWLTDHQMNTRVGEEFGAYYTRIPLNHAPTIAHDNALRLDWRTLLPPAACSYVLGNPPFIGAKYMNDAQREDARLVFADVDNGGLLDFVAAWYIQAARYIAGHPDIRCAFVSTNSICQGEQVGALWAWLLGHGIHIQFAHRTFKWTNEAKGKAAVHCVIIGFGLEDLPSKTLYEYEDIKGDPLAVSASNINPYLVDGPDTLLPKRRGPICAVPCMSKGSQPTDGGSLILSPEEKALLIAAEPEAEAWIRPFVGAEEFINSIPRYCLWLLACPPNVLRKMPLVMKRVDQVRSMRLESKKPATRADAATPTVFQEIRQPEHDYLLVPSVSSENRAYQPIGFMPNDVIASNLVLTVPDASIYHFGVLTAAMHMAWMRAVCGRLESRYRYSASIVYNNFPWPEPNEKQQATIEAAAQAVLDARTDFPDSSLADLYDPLAMPAKLLKAHHALDKAVDAAYGFKGGHDGKGGPITDATRVAFLFGRYQQLTSLLPAATSKPRRAKKA